MFAAVFSSGKIGCVAYHSAPNNPCSSAVVKRNTCERFGCSAFGSFVMASASARTCGAARRTPRDRRRLRLARACGARGRGCSSTRCCPLGPAHRPAEPRSPGRQRARHRWAARGTRQRLRACRAERPRCPLQVEATMVQHWSWTHRADCGSGSCCGTGKLWTRTAGVDARP